MDDRQEAVFETLKHKIGPERTNRAMATYRSISTASPSTSFIKEMYLDWCERRPADVGRDPLSKSCDCYHGFTPAQDGKWIPCHNCLPDTFESLDRERHS